MQAVLYRRRAQKNFGFEYRQNIHNGCTFRHFRPIMKFPLILQISKNFIWETFLQIKSYHLKTLMEEVKPIFIEKWIWITGYVKNIIGFRNFWTIRRFRRKDQDLSFFYWIVLFKSRDVAWCLDGKIHARRFGAIWVRKAGLNFW